MLTFRTLGASSEVTDALGKRGVQTPFAIQEIAIPDAIEGRDILAKSKTGSGKTLAFAVPVVERLAADAPRPAALVLVPTRELAQQVMEEFDAIADAKGLTVGAAYGGQRITAQAERVKKAQIIVATPGRLQDLADRKMISLNKVSILILDEADRMLDMGFQPQVDAIIDMVPADRQTMFFSATLDGHVGFLARRYTREPVLHEVESPTETVEHARHRFLQVSRKNKADHLRDVIETEAAGGLTLVFVNTKRMADRLGHLLDRRGVKNVAMHGDLTQAERQRSLGAFDRGEVKVLIATDVAARGLDLDEVTLVVNYDPPLDDKSYVHRVGRTARAGREGTAVTLVSEDEERDVGRMADRLGLAGDFEAGGMEVAPPQIVFSSHGRRSNLRPPTKRRL